MRTSRVHCVYVHDCVCCVHARVCCVLLNVLCTTMHTLLPVTISSQAHQHGDLYVTFTVKFPESLTKKQQQLVRDLFAGQHDEL